ncbi:MAG: triose-phosphate isomerase [Parcubacteria group bacterium CG10_big_fil_rev_8_21_14_0_10_38_31]|nr:MAG: triose-phosphate isomerase [Parcubacteria group bacterium CG10_big_fil_rev_8_21_14_0_10_38_31]
MAKKLIIANWKMSPADKETAKKFFISAQKNSRNLKNVDVVVCPPFVYLGVFPPSVQGGPRTHGQITLGAQDIFWDEKKTSYTGEVSATMLKKLGVKYVIIGHSERREYLGEDNLIVNKKVKYALLAGLKVVLCVGEKKRDEDGEYFNFIKTEIQEGLKSVPNKLVNNLIVAYEPIWAIGKSGKNADSPEKVFEISIYIKKVLVGIFGRQKGENIPILYGGSVDTKNTKGFLSLGGVVGLLVGHKSLEPEAFKEIVEIANSIK